MPAIYQADVWCDSCANAIRERLLQSATDEQREEWADESAYDSDEFPKYMAEDEESDCPQHCAAREECLEAEVLPNGAAIGALLSTSLTSDGVEYVKEAVTKGGEVARFWKEKFDWIDFPGGEPTDPIKSEMYEALGLPADGLVGGDLQFDAEAAIYWFAHDYHGGQWTNLYSVLSTSEFKPGPLHHSVDDEGEEAKQLYDRLVDEFA